MIYPIENWLKTFHASILNLNSLQKNISARIWNCKSFPLLQDGCPSRSSSIVGTESGRRHVLPLDGIRRPDCAVMIKIASTTISLVTITILDLFMTIYHLSLICSGEAICGFGGSSGCFNIITRSSTSLYHRTIDTINVSNSSGIMQFITVWFCPPVVPSTNHCTLFMVSAYQRLQAGLFTF